MTTKLLTAATATGAGTVEVSVSPFMSDHSYDIKITGAPTAVTVDLEGSLDGVSWAQIGTHAMTAGELTATFALVAVTGKPVALVRANLTTLTGGTSPTVTVNYGQDG